MSKKYKLTYFDIRGRAELTRLLFALVGKESELENERVSFPDWPKKKKEMPLGQMPLLEFEGKALCESLAIARYVAQIFGLHPKDLLQQAMVDQISDSLKDFLGSIFKEYFANGMKLEGLKTLVKDTAPSWLDYLEKMLKGKFFVGDSITMADLFAYEVLTTLLKVNNNILDKYPKLKSNREAVSQAPKIKEYLTTRKDSDI